MGITADVYTPLANAAAGVLTEGFDQPLPFLLVERGSRDWYPSFEVRVESLMPMNASTALIKTEDAEQAEFTESIGKGDSKRTHHYREHEDVSSTFETMLAEHDIVTHMYRHVNINRILVRGVACDPTTLQVGDRISRPNRRVPLELTAIYPPGKEPDSMLIPTTAQGQYIGDNSWHFEVKGAKGGAYIIDYDPTVETNNFGWYRRASKGQVSLEKSNEWTGDSVVLAGNPDTGLRLEDPVCQKGSMEALKTIEDWN